MPQSLQPGSWTEHWLWAARVLAANRWLTALAVAGGALVFAWSEDRAQARLLLALPLLVLQAWLEMRFFEAAIARRGEAAGPPGRARRFLGFGARWSALLVLFAVVPLALAVAAIIQFGEPYTGELVGRVLSVIGALGWWLGYALMGAALPAYLSGRPSGLGDAARRPGFLRRLRALAPPALLYLLAGLASNELSMAAGAIPGASSGYLLIDIALIGAVEDVLLLLASAFAARALTDDLLDGEGVGEEAVKVFE